MVCPEVHMLSGSRISPAGCFLLLCVFCAVHGRPTIVTPLGKAIGTHACNGVERYGSIPYAVPPLGLKRFSRAEVNTKPWEGGTLNASLPSAPCLQNPQGDPRSQQSESPPPTEDCLQLNIWRPSRSSTSDPLPVMVWIYGGGLCGGWAGNEYYNGSNLVINHNVLVVTVNYRLGPLGFMFGEDPSRPGTGGMNGIHDIVVALRWLKLYISSFGGNPNSITLVGQSSGAYSICTLCVAPPAQGLFHRAALLSGPCFGGPPSRGWGPRDASLGRQVSSQIMKLHNASSMDDLRSVPGEKLQWPNEWMNDLDKAPYFSGYFEDFAVVPASTEERWEQGKINPAEIIVSFTSKDGTAAFYGVSPVLGLVGADKPMNTPEHYIHAMHSTWGGRANTVIQKYPLSDYPTVPSTFIQSDADAYVICPSRRLARYAARAGRKVWVSEFAHFQPSPSQPQGFGCDAGVELDVVPGHHDNSTRLWAAHGSDIKYIFGTQKGPDGLGPPTNVTFCDFNPAENDLSHQMMAYWASLARHGDPNIGASPHALFWPRVQQLSGKTLSIKTLRLSVSTTDGMHTRLVSGVHDSQCDFWDNFASGPCWDATRQCNATHSEHEIFV